MNWGVMWAEGELHVVPVVTIDGDQFVSAAHILSRCCQCKPRERTTPEGSLYWNHNDPDHPGSE